MQIFIIHGGNSFDSYEEYVENLKEKELDYERIKPRKRWRDTIAESFTQSDILTPDMPNKNNAKFDEWKIWFEKMIPFFGEDVRLIGHSLGAMFLAKYLHEKPLKKPVRQLFLLAGGYGDGACYGQFTVHDASGLEKSAREIHLMHSQDDPVVPFAELDGYAKDLPTAKVHEFSDKNHFLDAEFPELIEILKQK